MNKKQFFALTIILGAALLILVLLLPGCSGSTASSAPASALTSKTTTAPVASKPASVTSSSATTPVAKIPKKGGTFRYIATRGPSTSIGWYADPTFRSGLWAPPLAESLLECDFSGNVKPKLATDWAVAADNKSLTLTLRKGVKFHDGTDFNAAAAKWDLDQLISGKVSGTTDWTSVDLIDDYTIRINLKNYLNTMLNTLSSGTCFMMSPTAFQKNGGAEGIRWNPVATGPFQFASFSRDVNLKSTKFSDYWQKDKPYIDAMENDFIGDNNTASVAFQAGNAEAWDGASESIEYDLVQKGYPCVKALNGDVFLMGDSKNTDSAFSNIKVRQALDYAIDREAIVKAKGFGFQETTYQLALNGTSSYITNLQNRSYNPDMAKKLLAEAGYPSGFNTTLYLDSTTIDQDEAVAVQSFLSKVGINTEFQILDNAKFTNLKMNGWKNGIMMSTEGVDANPNATLSRDFISTSPSWSTLLRTPDFNSLVQASVNSKTYDPELFKKVNQYMYDTAMMTFLWGSEHVTILQPYVRDTGFLSLQTWPLWQPANTWLDK